MSKREALDRAVELVQKKGMSTTSAAKAAGCGVAKLTDVLEALGEMVDVEGYTMRVHKGRAEQLAKAREALLKTGSLSRAVHASGLHTTIVYRYALRLGLDIRELGVETRRRQIIELRRQNPTMTKAEIAKIVGVSTSTVWKYWRQTDERPVSETNSGAGAGEQQVTHSPVAGTCNDAADPIGPDDTGGACSVFAE